MLQQHRTKKKKKPKRASRHFVNIITTFFAICLYYLRVCVCECVGCAGYFIIFAGCMIINLHLNHRHRRPCRADDWPVQVLLFFASCQALFFRAVVVPAVHFLGAPADGVCVCVFGYAHNIINHKVSHDFMLTPDLPPSWLGVLHLRLSGCNLLAFIFGGAALRDFQR